MRESRRRNIRFDLTPGRVPVRQARSTDFNQADIHNLLARFALDGGDPAEARKHAEIAKERAYCDGPPHYYKPAYEEAERLIAEASDTSG
ncbi:MAG: hypothetical protein R2748_23545 [Bryobacterales bacterium]